MKNLPRISGEEAIRILEKRGFVQARQRAATLSSNGKHPKELSDAAFPFIGSLPSGPCGEFSSRLKSALASSFRISKDYRATLQQVEYKK
jgi:hypothetical protein